MAAEEGEEARELRVAGRLGNGAMEGEVLGHRALAAMQRRSMARQRRADRADLRRVARSAARAAASTSTARRSSMT